MYLVYSTARTHDTFTSSAWSSGTLERRGAGSACCDPVKEFNACDPVRERTGRFLCRDVYKV